MNQQKRILGIDFGTTRIGLSLSDPLQIIAQPYDTISNDRKSIAVLCGIIQSENVELVIVGLPLNLKGERGVKAQQVEDFIGELEKAADMEIVRWDERFTTSMAHQTLLRMGTKREERRIEKGRVDAMAAAIMLQGFIDSRKRSLSC